ncbi:MULTISPECIES: ketopantoate reductase family protein [unclassified Brevibacterium]|uniref:ketopantoate reductase family protein n=1 Tax=unclassified Brevibacterium TaxID=2614124 RepID=UPI0008A30996|nr:MULTISPECIES: 2-dehydropantoate 2-reductase N-terminal domain-containing protein [unclassified Brevibacterium]OFL68735.1 hypothetical protein HMPREF2757_07450 [Brevibacterium sp. HMSC063G07]OFS25913.1 hypothetical protein HMPREF3162_07415 [Brevibacterium sp. HMSC07C04]
MSRYIIVGAGAIGGMLSAGFCRAGVDHVLVARGSQADAIETAGLTVRTPHETLTAHPTVVRSSAQVNLRAGDVIILAVKTQQLPTALAEWADLAVTDEHGSQLGTAGERLPLMLFLNGTDAQEQAPRWFATVSTTVIYTPAVYTEPGQLAVFMEDRWAGLITGPVCGPDAPRPQAGETDGTALPQYLQQADGDFTAGNFASVIVPEPSPYTYGKLLANLDNGIDALVGSLDHSDLLEQLQDEARAVYQAAGIVHCPNPPEELGFADRIPQAPIDGVQNLSSTWQSMARGTGNIEADYLGGEIVRLAHLNGIRAPKNSLVMQWCRRVMAGDPTIPADPKARAESLREAFTHLDRESL